MACVRPDGRPTESGVKMLKVIATAPMTPEEVAQATGLPLFRVRSGLREMVPAALALESDGTYWASERAAKFIV